MATSETLSTYRTTVTKRTHFFDAFDCSLLAAVPEPAPPSSPLMKIQSADANYSYMNDLFRSELEIFIINASIAHAADAYQLRRSFSLLEIWFC